MDKVPDTRRSTEWTFCGTTWVLRGPRGAITLHRGGLDFHWPGTDDCPWVGQCDAERSGGNGHIARRIYEAYEKAGYDEAVIWRELESRYHTTFEVAS